MAFPKQFEIEIPLLQTIQELGGSGKPKEIYPLVSKHFAQLTDVYILTVPPECRCSVPHE